MKRYQYLDVARGFGLLLVIISHSCGLSRFLINYYIPLFFVVSGYIYKEGRSYKENIEHKAKRLLIPYFGYSAVLLAVYVLMGRTLAETKASAFGILYSRYCLYDTTVVKDNVYLFTVANGAMWYLTAFFAASLVYHLVIDRCLSDRKFLIGTLIVLTAITMALADIPVLLPWSIDLACVGTIFMIAGTLLGRAQFFEKKWNIPLIAAVFVIYILTSCLDRLRRKKYDLPARLPHLCLRSCRTYCIQIYRNSCAGRRSCTICSVSCTAHYRRRPGMPCVFRNTEPVKETPASKDQVEPGRAMS